MLKAGKPDPSGLKPLVMTRYKELDTVQLKLRPSKTEAKGIFSASCEAES
jgi:hypothetical protein